ncbi:MAG: succinylglutamate desuccinylase/aspartoacylase family protein [Sphingomonadaceae bacterium]
MRFLIPIALLCAVPAFAATERAGDIVDGTPVVDRLDVRDLDAGQVHRFWFRAGDTAAGQGWYVPVIVVRGAQPGPRLMLTAGVHGDELSGIAVLHRLAESVSPANLAGTLVMIPGLNTPGLLNQTRGFTPGFGVDDNLNRLMPGDEKATDPAKRYAGRLWHRLMRPNADLLVDLHTQSRGTAYPMYAFVETKAARAIAEQFAPDIIKLDTGEKGTIENEMNRAGVPAITLELGRPEVFDETMIARAVDGAKRLMVAQKMLPADTPLAIAVSTPFVANSIMPVRTTRGGYATLAVALGDDVTAGQLLATVTDPFGRAIERIVAPRGGRIGTIATDPTREAGDMVVRIVWASDDPKCAAGC